MPPNWTPPVPAWRCHIGPADGLVVAHFGSQAAAPGPTALDTWLNSSRTAADGPEHVDRAVFVDRLGKQGRLALCYWRDAAAYQRWAAATDTWWADESRLREPAGYWREIYVVSSDRFETIWSSPDPHSVGIRQLSEIEGPMLEHAYWGAARDRLEISTHNQLLSPLGNQVVPSTEPTSGRRVRVRPPENLCVIRSGQDWSTCSTSEAQSYLADVEPSLRSGMSFLLTHPQETGCIDCRFSTEIDATDQLVKRTFGLAQFLTLGHLETWAKSHPTHLAIFDSFMAMLTARSQNVSLRLYHELLVTRRDNPAFEYINCHNQTGLLSLAMTGHNKHTAVPPA